MLSQPISQDVKSTKFNMFMRFQIQILQGKERIEFHIFTDGLTWRGIVLVTLAYTTYYFLMFQVFSSTLIHCIIFLQFYFNKLSILSTLNKAIENLALKSLT